MSSYAKSLKLDNSQTKMQNLRSSKTSDDIFSEFTSFREQLKKQYHEKTENSIRDFKSNLKNVSILQKTQPSNYKQEKNPFDGLEGLKKNIREISVKKEILNRTEKIEQLSGKKNNFSKYGGEESEKKNKNGDFKNLLKDFEAKMNRSHSKKDSQYRFGTSGAISSINMSSNLMVPSPKKEKKINVFESDRKLLYSKSFEQKLPLSKVIELQNLVQFCSDDEFNNLSQSYAEELIKLSSIIMQKVKKSSLYNKKYL